MFKFKPKLRDKTIAAGRKNVEVMVSLKYLNKFWRTPEMSFINCEISLILTRFNKCVLANDTEARKFAITDTKLYLTVETLSVQDNAKLLRQLKKIFIHSFISFLKIIQNFNIYIYIYIWIYIWINIYIYIYIYIHTYTVTHKHTNTCMHMQTYVCIQ